MLVKVSEATRIQRDWMVAKCEGVHSIPDFKVQYACRDFHFSEDWAQGGPLIEREHIHTGPHTYGPASVICNSWHAVIGFDPDGGEHLYEADGPTPLIAAMRCFVVSKLGEEVEVPDELT